MTKGLKKEFNNLLDKFPYPIMLINDDLSIALANISALKSFRLLPNKKMYINQCMPIHEKQLFIDFIYKLRASSYVQENIEFLKTGKSNVLGHTVDRKSKKYYFILILPLTFREKFKDLKQRYDLIVEHISDSVILTDENQKIIEVNKGFTNVTGFEFEDVVGRFPSLLSSGRHKNGFYKNMFIEMEQKGYFKGEIKDRKKSGEIINAEATIIQIKDKNNNAKNYIGILKDVSEVSKLKTKVFSTKHKDALTGVQNRESFLHILSIKCELATQKNELAILFIDLNKFKQVNDTYGHRYGDFVLSSAANRMQKVLRDNDLIGRYGGDEFIVLLERVNKTSAFEIAKKIQEVLSKPYVVDEQVINFISGSIGIAFSPTDSINSEELIEKADIAMYRAKKNLSDEHIMISDNIVDDENNKTLKTELMKAIDHDEFYLRIQPIVSTKDNKIMGGEVLSRWLNLSFNEVYPSTFIPMIETLGLCKQFDINVLSKSIELIENQEIKLDENFFIDVNFSAQQFSDDNFITILEDILEVKPWVKDHLVIEITESAMMVDIETTTEHLTAIRALGFKIAIDDFGTGFSSLSYLKHFAIDYLKIDKSFVDNIEDDKKDIAILKTIITLANAINAKIIVEGVECKEQYDIVKSLGVDYIQGYYFYKPILPNIFFSKYNF